MDKSSSLDNQNDMSVMLTKPSGRGVWTLRLKRPVFWGIIFVVLLFVISTILGWGYFLKKELDRQYLAQIEKKIELQSRQLDLYEESFQAIQAKIIDLIQKEKKIKDIMRPKSRRYKKKNYNRAVKKFERASSQIDLANYPLDIKIQEQISLVKETLLTIETGVHKSHEKLKGYKQRFSTTPSIWPVYGYIRSDYGYRIHPKTGRRQFHKGIDIPAWIGAPIKSAADGVVEFSNWGGGYGWLIIINHRFGYKTIYAHLSERDVYAGMRVSKGQVIGKVGDTGITTGPHLHYEIRRWQKAVSPKLYLDLDLFTASARIW